MHLMQEPVPTGGRPERQPATNTILQEALEAFRHT
jgi:hypothetical protein